MKKQVKEKLFALSALLLLPAALLLLLAVCVPALSACSDERAEPSAASSAAFGEASAAQAASVPAESAANAGSASSSFEAVFLDVGQGDSALISCDGRHMIIDGGSASKSDLVYTVLKRRGIKRLDAVVATHAHEDHVGGLSAVFEVCKADRVYCPVTEYDSKAFKNFAKQAEKSGLGITVPSPGDSFMLGSASVTFLGPLKNYEEVNNSSIVLKISYGDTSFLFTGDAERESELDLWDSGADLSAALLKVGHHGSNSSTCYLFLRAVMPKYAVISVGKDNSYGHPDEAVLSRLRDAGTTVLRTDKCGDIHCTSDGKRLSFATSKNCAPQSKESAPG